MMVSPFPRKKTVIKRHQNSDTHTYNYNYSLLNFGCFFVSSALFFFLPTRGGVVDQKQPVARPMLVNQNKCT